MEHLFPWLAPSIRSFNKESERPEIAKPKNMVDDKVVYLKGLNGLRAIAALSVVICHTLMPGYGNFKLPELFTIPMATFGVTMFFVISGFLITFLLILEVKKTNTVSIENFYVRRILRIWPLYYLYILTVLLIALITFYARDIFTPQIYWYIFFAANIPFIQSAGIVFLLHYWSIGVEEQFYLFWPWIVKYFFNEVLYFSIGLFASIFVVKSILWLTVGIDSVYYIFFTVSRFHCMMIGAIGAILYENNSKLINILDNKFIQGISWIFMALIGIGILYIPAPIAHELFSILSLIVIIGQIKVKNRIFKLENKLMIFLGKISYGMYIIHPIIILITGLLVRNFQVGQVFLYILIYSIVMGLTISFAYISYAYYERPFLNIKKRFAIVKSTSFQQ